MSNIPPVKFFVRLDLEQIILFPDGHQFTDKRFFSIREQGYILNVS